MRAGKAGISMTIHVVQPGENLYSISRRYGVSAEQIARDNQLINPTRLVVGEALVILVPQQVHTVQPGETLESIARQYQTTVTALLQNNPLLSNRNLLYPGQTVVIRYEGEKRGPLAVNGYAYPYIDREVLRKTLPYLTYLTLFTYGITPDGGLIGIDDEEVIWIAREYRVAPLMLISTLGEDGRFSNQLASLVLNDMTVQQNLINNIEQNIKEKNYYGLDVDFEYILPEDRDQYTAFIQRLADRLTPQGYPVVTALAPKTSTQQEGLLYEGHDYAGIGAAASMVLLMTYEWGYTYGPPMAVAPLNKVREVVEFAVTQIPPQKILMGMPNYGYNWTLPFVPGVSMAQSISNVAAVELAAQVGANILFDPVAQSPNFNYYDPEGRQHVVWFEDARSVEAKLDLAFEKQLKGISYWNIMRYFPQNWLVVNSLVDIQKVL